MHDGRLLAGVAGDLALRSLLVEELARLAHGEGDELALAVRAAGLAAAEHLHCLHGRRGAYGPAAAVRVVVVTVVAEELLVAADSVFLKVNIFLLAWLDMTYTSRLLPYEVAAWCSV